jgi:cysteine desulfurase
MSKPAKDTLVKWCKYPSNASGLSIFGVKARELLDKSIKTIKKHCNCSKYDVIFTSGASESNCTILRSVVNSWWKNIGTMPHIITSSIEHT